MPDAWFLQLKTVKGDFFKQESLFQKARTVFSLSLKQRTVEQAPHNRFSCLCSGVMSTLLNKNHSGRKPRQWTPDCPHCKMTSSLMGFVVDQSNQLCPTPTPTWCEWQLPQVVRVRLNQMPCIAFVIIPAVFEPPGSCDFPQRCALSFLF